MNFEKRIQRIGFHTTMRVEGNDLEAAEKSAFDSIRTELERQILNRTDDPPRLKTDSVYEVESFDDELEPDRGFTWYSEEDKVDYSTAKKPE